MSGGHPSHALELGSPGSSLHSQPAPGPSFGPFPSQSLLIPARQARIRLPSKGESCRTPGPVRGDGLHSSGNPFPSPEDPSRPLGLWLTPTQRTSAAGTPPPACGSRPARPSRPQLPLLRSRQRPSSWFLKTRIRFGNRAGTSPGPRAPIRSGSARGHQTP